MKKFIIIILYVFLIADVFSQSEVNIRYENRKKAGYYNITQIALMMGNRPLSETSSAFFDDRTESVTSPSVSMINGYIFNERVAAGIGTGFEIFDRNLFPVFFDIRRTLWDNRISPYFAFKIGYAFSGFKKKQYDNLYLNHAPHYINNGYFKKYGGFMFNPEMGVKVPLSENADVLFTVAYRHQKIKSTVWDSGEYNKWDYKVDMNRLSFGVAIMFR